MPKQHRKPCGACPFTTKCEPGATGGSETEIYVGQTYGPFWVPCHEFVDYDDPNWKQSYETPQCVGHAIMRDKCGVSSVMPDQLLSQESYEGDNVFESLHHFVAYHDQVPLEHVQACLTKEVIVSRVRREFMRAGAQTIPAVLIPEIPS